MIKFKTDTELTIVTGFDEKNDNITDEVTEVFKAGEEVMAEIIDERVEEGDAYVDLEFKNGVAFGVLHSCFEVVSE